MLGTIVLQGFTGMVKMRPLSPYTSKTIVVNKQDLTTETFFDGSYQRYLAEYARQKTGFREFFSRSYFQVEYNCFGKIANPNVFEGSHHELYLKCCLDDITGKLLMAEYGTVENAKSDVRKNIEQTLAMIDTLRQHGTQFLFVFCPTKPAVYPESMPAEYRDSIFDYSLVDDYVEQFKENGIPHIDFYNYFKTIKHTFPYPLYTRTGSHWAEATIPFVADSMLRKIEALTGYQLPDIELISTNLSRDYSEQDGELETHIDLLFPYCKPKASRPVATLADTVAKDRPNLLVVGDGYFVPLLNSCFVDAFNRWDFWKYNEISISSRHELNWIALNQLTNTVETLKQADVVIALYTSNYLFSFMNGFANTSVELYGNGCTKEQEAINAIMESIKNDPTWFDSVKQQAIERGISLEENLWKNASYIYQTRKVEQENNNIKP